MELLDREGRVDEALSMLRTRADQGDWDAGHSLAEMLYRKGRMDELRARADRGDWYAASRLAEKRDS